MRSDGASDRIPLSRDQNTLLGAILAQGIADRKILEIGCGTGRLHHRLLQQGAASVVAVELNAQYLEKARRLAQTLGHEARVTYLEGDFLRLAERIGPADVTVLDKVVHCSRTPERLVRRGADLTRHVFAVTFPRDHWRIRWIIRLAGPFAGLFLPFRVRFSRPEAVRGWVHQAGFAVAGRHVTSMWHVEVFVRRGAP